MNGDEQGQPTWKPGEGGGAGEGDAGAGDAGGGLNAPAGAPGAMPGGDMPMPEKKEDEEK